MGKKAMVAGHICLDITPVFANSTQQVPVLGNLLSPGKLVQMKDVDIHTGGAVSNTGLGMRVLGTDVKLLAKIGKDEFGAIIKKSLNLYDAGENLIESPWYSSSYTIVLAVPGVDRIFLHCPGANDTFEWKDIPEKELEDVSLFHFGYPPLMKKQYENNGEELVKIFQNVHDRGISTSLDMAAVDTDSEAAKADWKLILERVLPFVDFFVPSFEELCFMLEPERYVHFQKISEGRDITEFLDVDKDICPLAKKCIDMGAGVVLLKCGKKGMYLAAADSLECMGTKVELDKEMWKGVSIFKEIYPIEKVLSATGAGDVSIAAFLASVLNGFGPIDSLKHAAAAGALCCTAYDAITGLESLEEIHDMVKCGWNYHKSDGERENNAK